MARDRDDHDEILNEVKGKAALVTPWHGYQEGVFGIGTGRLMLTPTRVIDRTKFIITERTTTIPLDKVQGVALIATGNPLLLALGLATLIIGVGLVLLILYIFMKKRFLVVSSASTVQVISIKGDMAVYEDFVQDVLDEIDRFRKSGGSKGGSAAPAVAERPAVESSERVAAPAAEAKKTIAVRCPDCDAEYRVPANSAGKKFRCQKCQATIEVA